ncbi:MarR family winged helix-turn-helix transcriptional regulator [Xanthomonas euroxanthea]|uniref:MarR family winged helix-turn-helix transcriptional regulator n=1 Tax=Xanthomonas euroxanthea TaxID=2259622 RepID=UPI00141B0F03|nr:MarR family winged helix-turn-helix transcriptional regulator [Xanthomonas euroxanthea]MBB3777819.1 DNA-binding MarR family transcriptional regulator [Xanthomonas euroxanthea]
MSQASRLRLSNQVSFALYGAANRMVRMHKPFLEPLGLTFPQYLVMLELLDGAPSTVGVLGQRLDMDTGTITPLVKRLEAAGMLTRTRDPADERRVIVNLTARSRAMERDIRSITGKLMTSCKLSEQDAEDLRLTFEAVARPAAE